MSSRKASIDSRGSDRETAAPHGLDAAERDEELRRLKRFAVLLDSKFSILGIRFGIDGILSILPVVGDGIAALLSLYIVMKARRLGAPKRIQARMLLNVGLDFVTGSVPLLGTLFDVVYKANLRNIRILREYLGDPELR